MVGQIMGLILQCKSKDCMLKAIIGKGWVQETGVRSKEMGDEDWGKSQHLFAGKQ